MSRHPRGALIIAAPPGAETMTMIYTTDTLPNGIPALRTGTAADGRMLIAGGVGSLADIRGRLPPGWRADMYANGVDIVVTHEVKS